jgi:hypothetical protein
LPLPLVPDAMLIHEALLRAVHAQPDAAVTATVPSPPPAGSDRVSGAIANVQPSPCCTVTVCPATVIVPERDGPLVAAARKLTLPLPLPLAPETIVIQDALLAAVHPQPEPAVTATDASPPAAGTARVSGDTENVQPCPCTTVTFWPATVIVPDRVGPVVGAAVKVTVPDPLPLAPDAMVIQGALLDAVHAHPPPVVTETVPFPPADGTVCVSGVAAYVQPWPWTTVTVCPATLIEPVRDGPVVPATAKVTVPGPVPLEPAVMVIHGTLLAAVHAHPAAAATLTVRLPPPGSVE